MGLYQDQTNSLSEIKRLAVLVMDDSRRGEIGADQWPLAMIAYGLVTCNDDNRTEEGIAIYSEFSALCPADVRRKCAFQLSEFIKQRQGNGWRSLLPFALADEDEAVRRQAAFLIGTLAPPQEGNPYAGFNILADLICSPPFKGQRENTPLFDALMGTADLRFMAIAASIRNRLSTEQLDDLLSRSTVQANALSCEWMLETLSAKPGLSGAISTLLAESAARVDEIVDVILPVPSWLFQNAEVQPLHGWNRAEYYGRMKGRLESLVSPDELDKIKAAWLS